jgi:hypothetical protein
LTTVNVRRALPKISSAPRYARVSISSGAAGGSIRMRVSAGSTRPIRRRRAAPSFDYCRFGSLHQPPAAGSSASAVENVADRVARCSTVKAAADFTVIDDRVLVQADADDRFGLRLRRRRQQGDDDQHQLAHAPS